jgi:Tfp pilus assembly protein PilX
MPSPNHRPVRRAEQGMALVIALLLLLALTALGTALMMSVNTEGHIAGNQMRDAQALSVAEAGVQEAMLRLRTGDVPDNLNKRMVTLIYEAPAGSIPVSSGDTTSLPTLQPSGSYLGYSSATKKLAQGSTSDLQVLTVRYKTVITPGSPPDTQIVKYEDTHNPKFNTAVGSPVFQIVSTGTKGQSTRNVVAEVTRAKMNILARAALSAHVGIQFKGNVNVCGHDHRADTPPQVGPGTCDASWLASTSPGSDLPGGWSEGSITKQGSANIYGTPSPWKDTQTGFYSGPWEALGMSQADFWAWVGPPRSSLSGTPHGIYYLDDDAVKQNQSGDWGMNGGDGDGFIYCDGDFSINGNTTFKGLLYVEGDLKMNGNCWLLGGLIVRGKSTIKCANGSAILLYSSESIQQNISKYAGNIRMLSWREF